MSRDFNVILIIADGLRTNLGCYGYLKPTTPFIDELAKEGVLFEDAYACTNHTDPSFTTMLTGKYPITHGITHHDFKANRITPKELKILDKTGSKFLSEILNERGYTTIAFDWLGRWHRRGFDYYGESGPSFSIREVIEKRFKLLPSPIDRKLKRFFHQMGIPLPARSGEYYTNAAVKFIKKRFGERFFMLMHSWDTHTPFDTLPFSYIHKFYEKISDETVEEMLQKIKNKKWREIVKKYHLFGVKYVDEIPALYDGAVNFFDHTVKVLVKCLEECDILEKTIIIITGDHGDNPLHDGVFVGHFGLYDPVIHVPLILIGPGIPKNRRVGGFVQHVDIFPTLLEILGIDYSKFNPDGKSLLPLIHGKKKSLRSSVIAIDGAARRRYAIRTDDYKYIYSPTPNESMVRFDIIGCRYQIELYDLKKDPNEKENIAEEKPDKAEKLRKKLLSKISELEKKKLRLIKEKESKKMKESIQVLKKLGKI